jgi:hypothetical protein
MKSVWLGYVARSRQGKKYTLNLGSIMLRAHLGGLGLYERIILKWILHLQAILSG